MFNLISDTNLIPEHHYHIHLLSIPRIFYNKNDLFVSPVNFFQKKDSLEKKWTEILKKYKGIKIGINSNTSLIKKNIPFDYFLNLASSFDFTFFVLQKEIDNKKIDKFKNIIFFKNIDKSENAFIDSIQIIKQLDLVITADTALAHLSGTLGKKTWIPLPFVSDWRWFLDNKSSKWYKNVSLYRSKQIDNWESPFKMINEDLKKTFK